MELGMGPPKKVPIYAHPNIAILNTGIGLAFGVLSVYFVQRLQWRVEDIIAPHHEEAFSKILWILQSPWASLALGIVVGLPIVLIEKRLLRSSISFYADFFTIRIVSRFRWSVMSRNLVVCLPLIAGPFLALGLSCLFRVAPWPAFFGTNIWLFLTYPEQRAIYEAAKLRLRDHRDEQR